MLVVRGIEVNQAIQYYRSAQHLTDPSEQLPDNSVTLIANKPAWVRVYVESDDGPVASVTGTLTLSWSFLSPLYGTAPLVLNAQPPGRVTAQVNPNYQATRSSIATTLNFIVPAEHMIGDMVLVAAVPPRSLSFLRRGRFPWRPSCAKL